MQFWLVKWTSFGEERKDGFTEVPFHDQVFKTRMELLDWVCRSLYLIPDGDEIFMYHDHAYHKVGDIVTGRIGDFAASKALRCPNVT